MPPKSYNTKMYLVVDLLAHAQLQIHNANTQLAELEEGKPAGCTPSA